MNTTKANRTECVCVWMCVDVDTLCSILSGELCARRMNYTYLHKIIINNEKIPNKNKSKLKTIDELIVCSISWQRSNTTKCEKWSFSHYIFSTPISEVRVTSSGDNIELRGSLSTFSGSQLIYRKSRRFSIKFLFLFFFCASALYSVWCGNFNFT